MERQEARKEWGSEAFLGSVGCLVWGLLLVLLGAHGARLGNGEPDEPLRVILPLFHPLEATFLPRTWLSYYPAFLAVGAWSAVRPRGATERVDSIGPSWRP